VAKLKKLKLQGFNNLTKTLSFNIYDICYAESDQQKREYIEYIDEAYNAERLKIILKEVVNIIGAKVLNIAHQDYEPMGASVNVLICEPSEFEQLETNHASMAAANSIDFSDHAESENSNLESRVNSNSNSAINPDALLAHLDKSHLSVHTYPESHPDEGISTFRVDIDVSTCGTTSPLNALNYLINSFESDIITLDYRVRGFTRNIKGKKHFIDHKINSIQNYLARDIQNRYQMIDVNVYQENIFHTKMMLKEFELEDYLFGMEVDDLGLNQQRKIRKKLLREMTEIFYGRNINP